jgi:Family of unknown function (DUF6152)
MKSTGSGLILALCLACAGSPGNAHHSTAEFDYSKAYAVTGTVKELQWTNPHAWVQVLVPNKLNTQDQWGFEMGAPLFNIRMGWKKTSVVPGQKVTVVFSPSRVRARGTLLRIVFSDGSELKGIAQNFYRGPKIEDVKKVPAPPPLARK